MDLWTKCLLFVGLCVSLVACAPLMPAPAAPASTPLLPTFTPTLALQPPLTPPLPLPTVPATSSFQLHSSEAWCWQELLGVVNSLNDVFFLDINRGWAVGEHGTILYTENAGDLWQRQLSPVDTNLQHVVFVDDQNGWILNIPKYNCDAAATLLHTTDGGLLWEVVPLPFLVEHCGSSITMIWADAEAGWLLDDMQVFHTLDAGLTWQQQTLPLEILNAGTLVSVDRDHAWIVAGDTLLRTDDGGQTWIVLPLEDDISVWKAVFLDEQVGWALDWPSRLLHTLDGGQTWQVQHEDLGFRMEDIFFLDDQNGWLVNYGGNLLQTRDGGESWVKLQNMPHGRSALTFVDALHGWSVGRLGWGDSSRQTILHTEDGGVTWQVQDLNIEMPPQAYTVAARLDAYLNQSPPPLEAMVTRWLTAPCHFRTTQLISSALSNLGWRPDGEWGAPLFSDEQYSDLTPYVQRLDIDLDDDGFDEVLLYNSGDPELFIGVLDWDGTQWQVSWSERIGSSYSGNTRVSLDDLNDDGRPELFMETLTHPGSGTGFLIQQWDVKVLQCEHLHCSPIWTAVLGQVARLYQYMVIDYDLSAASYRFVDQSSGDWPAIELQQYGLTSSQPLVEWEEIPDVFDAQIMTRTQTIYRWDGSGYALAEESVLEPSYPLDNRPLTETLDLGADGTLEQLVQAWVADGDGLRQTLSLYARDDAGVWQPTQVLTSAFIDGPRAGVHLQSTDVYSEVMFCTSYFRLSVSFNVEEWPRMEPDCTVYRWNSTTQSFLAFSSELLKESTD